MAIWFTSDTRFGHEKVIEYEKRPFADADTMDEVLINNWNQKVKPEDTIYHLGDVTFNKKARSREIIQSLNGVKICIHGNHDGSHRSMESLGFAACMESCYLILGGHHCFLNHEPFPVVAPDCWQLHGHVHSKWKVKGLERRICLSVENWQYAPINAKELIGIMDKLTKKEEKKEKVIIETEVFMEKLLNEERNQQEDAELEFKNLEDLKDKGVFQECEKDQ